MLFSMKIVMVKSVLARWTEFESYGLFKFMNLPYNMQAVRQYIDYINIIYYIDLYLRPPKSDFIILIFELNYMSLKNK